LGLFDLMHLDNVAVDGFSLRGIGFVTIESEGSNVSRDCFWLLRFSSCKMLHGCFDFENSIPRLLKFLVDPIATDLLVQLDSGSQTGGIGRFVTYRLKGIHFWVI
jgi:hypothetical protein